MNTDADTLLPPPEDELRHQCDDWVFRLLGTTAQSDALADFRLLCQKCQTLPTDRLENLIGVMKMALEKPLDVTPAKKTNANWIP